MALRIDITNSATEFIFPRLQNDASDMRTVFELKMARRTYLIFNFSTLVVLKSKVMRAIATCLASSVRKEAVFGGEGRITKTVTPRAVEMMPSKKKIFRHVWMMPHGGIWLNPDARRPPNALLTMTQ